MEKKEVANINQVEEHLEYSMQNFLDAKVISACEKFQNKTCDKN